jgi:hypothetical protein
MIYDAVLTKYIYCYVYWKESERKIHDQYEILCGLEYMILDDVLSNLRCSLDWNICAKCCRDVN